MERGSRIQPPVAGVIKQLGDSAAPLAIKPSDDWFGAQACNGGDQRSDGSTALWLYSTVCRAGRRKRESIAVAG
jgi:hypothetical protein